jgi:hypothetical protein
LARLDDPVYGRFMVRSLAVLLLTGCLLPACREGSPPSDPAAEQLPAGSAAAPTFVREGDTVPAKAPAEPAATSEPKVVKDEPGEEPTADAPEEPAAPEAPSEPVPDVEVRNVGMHIGGEKNTQEQKRPIRSTISKHYDAMKRCWAKADDPPNKATFGVDIRIDGKGGAAKITNPRNGLRGEGVTACMMAVFEAIEFPPQPNSMDRMVSYSVEFAKR